MFGGQVICWGVRSYVWGSGHMLGGQVICWGVQSYVGGSGHMFGLSSFVS